MKQKHHYTFETKAVLYSGLLTFALLCILFAVGGLAPFGSKSLAVMDADIQYLDFFSYFKDVLSGKNTIGYTFGKTLGGSNIAVFSYYLSSPFNLLLFFFSNQQLHTFFDLVVALKLTLASVAFAYFSVHRFNRSSDENLCLYVLISTAYGLCQYNFAQASNIMWLDGVYMLPFILLQVYYIVRGKKSWTLSFLVGTAILFNWYSAGIDSSKCTGICCASAYRCAALPDGEKNSTTASLNASSAISVTDAGISSSSIAFPNAFAPMRSKPSGSFSAASATLPWNACVPMLRTPCGMVSVCIRAACANIPCGISVSDFGKCTDRMA